MHIPSSATRRTLPAFFAIAVVASLGLAACASPEVDPEQSSESASAECAAAGEASDAVSVAGELGAAPEVSFDTPLEAEGTQRTVVIEGDGATEAAPGDTVTVSYTLYNGSTGEEIESTGHDEAGDQVPFTLDETMFFPGIVQALGCATAGDRIAAVVAPDDAFGEAGSEQLGIGAEDPLVFVFDVVDVTQPVDAADDLTVVEPGSEGLPSVEYAEDGAPTVVLPESEPLTELTLAVITEGDGDVVAEGDTVTVHYTGVNWNTGEVFDSSWTRGEPATFATTGVIPGFGAALVDQPVGSQVLVVIPPAYGYGAAGQGEIGGTDTIVFAVDILGTTAG